MAGTVAYVSVSGLLKVFTGAGTLGLMLFTAIEIAKMVATSAIHTYGKKIGWFYSSLLSIMILISMAITSMGIYGFLSSSYKESFAKMENVNNQVTLLESKRDGYQNQLNFVNTEKESINLTITELSKGLSNNVIQYKDPKTGQIITSTSSSTRKTLEKQLDNAIIRQDEVTSKADSLTTIIFDLENQILETKLGNESANELSSLKYLSDITGKSMDEVMKWFILLLIIIGDPMAVLMVIVFNKVVKKNNEDDDLTVKLEPTNPVEPTKPTPFNHEDDEHRFEDVNTYIKEPEVEIPSDYITQIQDNIRRGIPIKDTTMNDVVTDAINEHVEIEVEESLPAPITDAEIVQEMIESNKQELENTAQEQIIENIEEVKQLKREPVIPRGRIIEEDVVKKRDFSVDVPEPQITRIGANKEIRDNKDNVIIFKRRRKDELGNED